MMELVVYVREGCPHCERLLEAIEGCPGIHAKGVSIVVVPALRGPLVRGSMGRTPMEERHGPAMAVVPQLVIRGWKGGRVLEIVVAGAPRDREEFCRALDALATLFA